MSNESIEECLFVCKNIYPEWGGTHPETYEELCKELAELRANQLPANIVAAVRAYQEAYAVSLKRPSVWTLDDKSVVKQQMLNAIEADAKDRG